MEIKHAEKQAGMAIYAIGEALSKIRKMKKEWKKLGDHVTTFEEVLKEIGYSPASGYNYIKINEIFRPYVLENPSFCGISYTRLVHLLPVMHDKDGEPLDKTSGLEHLEAALLLPTDGKVKEYVKGLRGMEPDIYCQHPEVTTHYKCKCCKQWVSA